jgi:hypothetical protein
MDFIAFCWKLEIHPLRALVLPMGKIWRGLLWTFIPCVDSFPVLVESLFHPLCEGEGKQVEPDARRLNVLNDDSVAEPEEVLEMHVRILTWQTRELVCLYHRDEAGAELEVSIAMLIAGPTGTLATAGTEYLRSVLAMIGVVDGAGLTSSSVGGVTEEEVARDCFFLRSASGFAV